MPPEYAGRNEKNNPRDDMNTNTREVFEIRSRWTQAKERTGTPEKQQNVSSVVR